MAADRPIAVSDTGIRHDEHVADVLMVSLTVIMRDELNKNTETCAHPSCNCAPANDSKYCSTLCEGNEGRVDIILRLRTSRVRGSRERRGEEVRRKCDASRRLVAGVVTDATQYSGWVGCARGWRKLRRRGFRFSPELHARGVSFSAD